MTATIGTLAKFFGGTLTQFKTEWAELSQEEKDWFKAEYDKVYSS